MSADLKHERLLRIARVMAAANGEHPAQDLCQACVEVVAVSGASVMVMSDGLPNPLASSDPVAARIEDLQHTIGEGPCIDAYSSGRAVFEPDLAESAAPRG